MSLALLFAVGCPNPDDEKKGSSDDGSFEEACQRYLDAAAACYGVLGYSLEEVSLSEDYCVQIAQQESELDDRNIVDLWTCYTDILESGDCTTEEGLDDIAVQLMGSCM